MLLPGMQSKQFMYVGLVALITTLAVDRAAGSCVIPSAANSVRPSPALAMCSKYQRDACCTLDSELSFLASIMQAGYTAPACKTLMMELNCGVSCHPQQSAFVAGTTVRMCASFCTNLHASCGDGDDAGAWCAGVAFPWHPSGFDTAVVADADAGPVEEGCSLTLGSSEEEGIATTTCELTVADADVPVVGSCAVATGSGTCDYVAPAAGSCWGQNDGCDGMPNSGEALDSCGVCGGDSSTCVAPGASRAASIRETLAAKMAEHNAASVVRADALSGVTAALQAKLATEQARVAAARTASLETVTAEREKIEAMTASSAADVATGMAEVSANLAAVKLASAAALQSLSDDVAESSAAVQADYARVKESHDRQSLLHTAVLDKEMATWQENHDEVLAEIARLKGK
jgi:hypothetical protein